MLERNHAVRIHIEFSVKTVDKQTQRCIVYKAYVRSDQLITAAIVPHLLMNNKFNSSTMQSLSFGAFSDPSGSRT